ncbi:MAG: DNA internalization-related competence protein ComEC/Rec2 [Candidatus Polarisedimenticolaceae bacterium]|nr:DNA internalization-related competence protein ComEC/Rec2 [Candidatus Polarisedimenticolaceae bacterium]
MIWIQAVAAFVVGVLLLQFQIELPALWWFFSLSFLFFAFRLAWLRLLCFGCLGFLWALMQAHWLLGNALDPLMEGRDLLVEGVIVSLPEQRGQRTRFRFELENLHDRGEYYPASGTVRLNWYRNAPRLKVGERWQLQVRLRRPHGFMNPGGFDYEGWLFREGIHATGYVRESQKNRKLAESNSLYLLQSLRQSLREKIYHAVADPSVAGIIVALVIGERSGLSRKQWNLLARTGTNHLVAISGLHIGIIAGLVFFLFRRLWSCSARLCLYLPAPQAAAISAILAALFYAALAGFAVPTQRALIMLAVVMGGILLRRQQQPLHLLAVALLLVVLVDPQSVMLAGFWLSFVAVAVILYGLSGHLSRAGLWAKWGRVQWVVAIGLAPLLLAWGMQVSLFAPLVNMVAVPLFSLLVVPLALLGSLLLLLSDALGGWVLWPLAWLLEAAVDLLERVASQPFSAWEQGGIPSWSWLPAALGVLLLLAPAGLPGRWLGLIFLLPLLLVRPNSPVAGELWFTLLDVGQGLSAVIQTQHHTLVFDAGARFSDDFDAGSAVVVPFLHEQGISHIDRLILSNADNDHAGGASKLVEQIPVREILSGEPGEISWGNARQCTNREEWEWDAVTFRFLYPAEGSQSRGNNASCVLLVENAAGRILLTADIEREAESWLLAHASKQLAAEIVQVPHHGSRSSSTQGFVTAVAPDYALVPAGYRNRYRFPQPKVVRRWQAAGATVFNTANRGAIRYRLHPVTGIMAPEFFRADAKRYWHIAKE